MKFPTFIDILNPDIYFSIFDIPPFSSKENIIVLSNMSEDLSIEDILNSDSVIKMIARNEFGMSLVSVGETLKAEAFIGTRISDTVSFSEKAGYYSKKIFEKMDNQEADSEFSVVIYSNKIEMSDESIFSSSSYINAIYNIICIRILLISQRDGKLPEIF